MDKNEAPYNRIVLIGNGFDKALGLKTSYSDFILYHLKEATLNALKKVDNKYNLIKVTIENPGLITSIREFDLAINQTSSIPEFKEYLFNKKIQYTYLHDFLDEVEQKYIAAKWVDIEQHYYYYLIRLFNAHQTKMNFLIQNVNTLHKYMDILRSALDQYMSYQQDTLSVNYLEYPLASLIEKIRNPLKKISADLIGKHKRLNPPNKILFLNFNYTNVLERYLDNTWDNIGFEHIYIHGKVENKSNPIIFGYGDDTRAIYKELENTGEEELLIMIKAFQYPRTANYHKLLLFLRDYEYDVFVIGHSCGLSDSTLLNTIFEDSNCLAIQAFYYKDIDEFIRKNLAISRHFNDKKLFRERVLIFDKDAKIPQVT